MCRNIKTLFNYEPPATNDEVQASALQFVRKLSGTTKPSKANEDAFNRAVAEVTVAARRLVDTLITTAPPKDRAEEAIKAKARSAQRFGPRTEADHNRDTGLSRKPQVGPIVGSEGGRGRHRRRSSHPHEA